MKIGSLFAGIGGFDLAARWMGWETAWFSEIDPYACGVLAKHWPNVPNYGDITQLTGANVQPIDVLCGGWPCQDISLAGKGAGLAGKRSGLWSHFARLINELRPRWVVAENVSALRSRGLDQVLGGLAALGYDAEWHCIPAAAVGAPHRRDRIWIVAYTERGKLRQQPGRSGGASWADSLFIGAYGAAQFVAHANSGGRNAQPLRCTCSQAGNCPAHADGSGPAVGGQDWWTIEPALGRVAHGVPARVDRLRCLGNAIVPQLAFVIFQAIQQAEEMSVGA